MIIIISTWLELACLVYVLLRACMYLPTHNVWKLRCIGFLLPVDGFVSVLFLLTLFNFAAVLYFASSCPGLRGTTHSLYNSPYTIRSLI